CLSAWVACAVLPLAAAETRDVLKSNDIDAMLRALSPRRNDRAIQERPNYSIWLKVHEGRPGPFETHEDFDDIMFVRRGSARPTLGERAQEIGAGDVALIPRKTAHQIDPGAGRLEYVVVRVAPAPEGSPRAGIRPATGRLEGVLKKSQIDETLAKFEA